MLDVGLRMTLILNIQNYLPIVEDILIQYVSE